VTRRIAAFAGLLVVVSLALLLLWRVYVHHTSAEPYDREDAAIVRLGAGLDRSANAVKFAGEFC
jgi:drug/metabolite transporter superfamily protein YnfA